MKKKEAYGGFEQGPIRPPSEANSLLIRITRNCPWNFCTFCPVYKGEKFSLRPVEHVLRDIDRVHEYVDALTPSGSWSEPISRNAFQDLAAHADCDRQALHAAHSFVAGGMRSIFLQDGNSLIIKSKDLLRILYRLKELFPMVERITSYARSHTITKINDAILAEMAEAGLNRIHIGLESGSDKVLTMVKKGVDKATQVNAGKKVKKAGMELSEYYIPGLGGRALAEEHALETADALNSINPDFIRLRTLGMPGAAPLTHQFQSGDFDKMGEVDTSRELLLFLEALEGIDSTVKSDHVLNLFAEVEGVLPADKEKMVQPVRDFLALSREEQMIFCIGRRTHRISRLSDMNNPIQRDYAMQMCSELGATVNNMDEVIDEIMKRFI